MSTNYAKLVRSSFKIIRTEGPGAFLRYLRKWLGGERSQYHPDEKPKPISYPRHMFNTEPVLSEDFLRQLQDIEKWAYTPRIAILTVIPHASRPMRFTALSVKYQTYTNWRWYVATVSADDVPLEDDRVVRAPLDDAYKHTIDADYVMLLDPGDQLPPYALYTMVQAVKKQRDADYFYADQDRIDDRCLRSSPWFKPDYSPEMLLSVNYLSRSGLCRRDVWDALQPYTTPYDFALRLSETTDKIIHVPQVLYHRHKSYPHDPDEDALRAHLRHKSLKNPSVERDANGVVRVRWEQKHSRTVSIIIPSRDQADLVAQCLASIFTLTNYPDFEVVLVDTGSTDPATQAVYDRYTDDSRFRRVDYTGEFNFSRACNLGANHADGDLLLFLNNDTEVLQADWLQGMAQWFEYEQIGAVGAKLLYPDGTLQHAGVILGLHGLAGHILALEDEHTMTLYGSDDWVRNMMAVTGACLMLPRKLFDEVGRFDEGYTLNYSDVELCLAVRKAGYRIVYTPHVRLKHYESATHQKQIPIADTYRFNDRLQKLLRRGDPYYNPNLSYQSQVPTFRRNAEDTAEQHNKVMMAAVKRKLDAERGVHDMR